MPTWTVWIIAAAGVVTSLTVIWTKVLKPLNSFISLFEEAVPLLRAQVTAFKGVKDPYPILEELIAQTRSDSGATLRDAINRTEEIAHQLAEAEVESRRRDERIKRLAAKDRRQLEQMAAQIDVLTERMK